MNNIYLLNTKRTAIGKFLEPLYDPDYVDLTIGGNVIFANIG